MYKSKIDLKKYCIKIMNCLICYNELTLRNKNFQRCNKCDKELCNICIYKINNCCPFCKLNFKGVSSISEEKATFKKLSISLTRGIVNTLFLPLNLIIIPLTFLGGNTFYFYIRPKN